MYGEAPPRRHIEEALREMGIPVTEDTIKAYEQGYLDGFDDGYETGYEHGLDDGREEGREEGYREGYDEGYRRGYEDAKYGYPPEVE